MSEEIKKNSFADRIRSAIWRPREEKVAPLPVAEAKKPEEELSVQKPLLIGGIYLDLVDLPKGTPAFQMKDGKIFMDKTAFAKQQEEVKGALAKAIEEGNVEIFERLTKGLKQTGDPDLAVLYKELLDLFEKRTANPSTLKAINVDLLTDGIAQRNIIREGLKPEINKHPFVFRDRDGNPLAGDNLDYVFVQGKNDTYKLIVGSKKGIDSIELPDNLTDNQFTPDLLKIEKDPVSGAITIPLKDSKDGTTPVTSFVEIHKGPIDIIARVKKQESEEQAKKARRKSAASNDDEEDEENKFNPPSPRAPRRSSESGGYGYTSVSG